MSSGPTEATPPKGPLELSSLEFPAKILIADDDPSMIRLLEHSFQKYSRVLVAVDGEAALEMVHNENPDFIVTDLSMPKTDGLEFLRRLRSSFAGASIPTLMLTSNQDESDLVRALEEGADDFVTKPLNVREVCLRICSIHIRQRRARDVNPLSRLPGNLMIKREIERRLAVTGEFAIAYVDLDHFKAFNDYQGFDRGDHVIELIANVLRDYGSGRNRDEIFVGHVGGDDFVVLLPIDSIQDLADHLDTKFAEATELLYSPRERERGYYEAVNRQGKPQKFPLLSVSTGVVKTKRGVLDDLRRIAHVAAEVKTLAKAIPGNSLFVDRRKTYE